MALYSRMKNAIRKTGRPIVLSICEKGQSGVKTPWTWSDSVGHMWRTTNDINPAFSTVIGRNVNGNAPYDAYTKPGGFNDPDMLEVGNTTKNMTETQFRSHFSLWCVMASPLMAGNDIRDMTSAVTSILTNRYAIAVDQDSLGQQGKRIANGAVGDMVFVKKMKNPALRAVLLFNNSASAMDMTIRWTDANMGWNADDNINVFDIWAARKTSGVSTGYTAKGIPAYGCAFLLLGKGVQVPESATPVGSRFPRESASLEETSTGWLVHVPNAGTRHSVDVVDMLGRRTSAPQVAPGVFGVDKDSRVRGVVFVTLRDGGVPVRCWKVVGSR